jgi:hypothetical protein
VIPDALHLAPKTYEIYGQRIVDKVKELTSANGSVK